MAQTPCPFCGALVDDAAAECPRCNWRLRGPRSAAHVASAREAELLAQMRAGAASHGMVPMAVYALLALGFLYYLPPVLGVVLAYTHRGAVRGTWAQSHCEWQIRTFWMGLAGFLAVAAFSGVMVTNPESTESTVLFVAAAVCATAWYAWRVIRGAVMLHRGEGIR